MLQQAKLNLKLLSEASEKFWGAAVQILKSLASKEGRVLPSHRGIWGYVEATDSRLPGFALRFLAPHELHINFYEGHLSYELVEKYSDATVSLIEELKRILKPPS